jgi:hypothetical protein
MTIPLEHKPSPSPGIRPLRRRAGFLDELRAVYTAIDDDDVQTEVFDVEGTHAAVRYRRMLLEDRLRTQGAEGARRHGNATRNSSSRRARRSSTATRTPASSRPPSRARRSPSTGARTPRRCTRRSACPETDVRRSVLRLFQGVDEALLRHAEEVDRWMGRADTKTAERFAGG